MGLNITPCVECERPTHAKDLCYLCFIEQSDTAKRGM